MGKDNFGFKHKSGILMAVSSLPSPYGIGTMGAPCFKWIDALKEMKQTVWQVLPLGPTAYGDSPYQSPSAMAGNPYYIDLEDLHRQGLLTVAELNSARRRAAKVDYGWLFNTRIALLRKAYARFEPTGTYYQFRFANRSWLLDYAHFMALKVKNGYKSWNEWAPQERDYRQALVARHSLSQEMSFWCWLQFVFFTQWSKVKHYAHKQGVRIIGDMPIYVAFDGVEVWSRPDQFCLDQDLNPTVVAGCPPDGFSPDGQLWGNPIYNWNKMKEDGYKWWIERIGWAMKLYDIVRIDHFRGFAGYYTIRFGDTNARDGWWNEGPGKDLFAVVNEALPKARIIAEDLGFVTPDVRELLDYTGYPGMKILQFAFFDEDSEYLPRVYTTDNCIAYTGSHDADCTYSWCKGLDGETKKRFRKECPRKRGETRTRSLIRLAMTSRANLAVIPWQDYLELSNEEGRMNTPAVAEGNWTWRAARQPSEKMKKEVALLTKATKRA